MQRSLKTGLTSAAFAAALAAALSAAPAPTLAQNTPAQDVPAQNAPASQAPLPMQAVPNPTDQQLQRFASASQKVAGVVDEYRPKVEAAKTDDAKQKIVQEADAKMVKLVRADGLSVEEFNGISRAVEQNPQLKQRVIDLSRRGAAPR